MANPAGAKGYRGEFPVAAYLLNYGFRRVYRLRNQGISDKGDIGGIDKVCIEVKNHGVYKLSAWMKEVAKEKLNAGASTAALVVKPKGIGETRVNEWWVMMTLEDYAELLLRAGYGPWEEHDDGAAPRTELRV